MASSKRNAPASPTKRASRPRTTAPHATASGRGRAKESDEQLITLGSTKEDWEDDGDWHSASDGEKSGDAGVMIVDVEVASELPKPKTQAGKIPQVKIREKSAHAPSRYPAYPNVPPRLPTNSAFTNKVHDIIKLAALWEEMKEEDRRSKQQLHQARNSWLKRSKAYELTLTPSQKDCYRRGLLIEAETDRMERKNHQFEKEAMELRQLERAIEQTRLRLM